MKVRIHIRIAVVLITAGLGLTAQATTFTLDPVGGGISGFAGETVGWGFTFFNDTDYAVITSSSFVESTPIGTYSDYISTVQFSVIGPSPESTTWTQTFDSGAQTGVGQYVIDPLAILNSQSAGSLTLTYDLYSLSPNDLGFDPDLNLVSSGNIISADASVTVTETPAAGTPEPALGFGAGLMFCMLFLTRYLTSEDGPRYSR